MNGNPEELVNAVKARAPVPSFQDRQSLANNQVLYNDPGVLTKQPKERAKAEQNQLEHSARL